MNAVAMPGTETPMIPYGHADTPMSACQSAIDGASRQTRTSTGLMCRNSWRTFAPKRRDPRAAARGAARPGSRLKRLRTQASRVPQIESRASEAAAALTRAREALQPGSEFSLEVVDRAFNDALCGESTTPRHGTGHYRVDLCVPGGSGGNHAGPEACRRPVCTGGHHARARVSGAVAAPVRAGRGTG